MTWSSNGTGAVWETISNDSGGDITGVSVTTGLTGGATSGDVTIGLSTSQTTIQSLRNNLLIIGGDSQNNVIDFSKFCADLLIKRS